MDRKRVLIVDDEPQIREALEAYLQREGLEVESSGTVAEARAAIERGAPDLVLLDVSLPDGSGFDVLGTLAKPGQRVPTIMLTARSEETDRVVGLELGADDYVTKPFSPREVVARVRALFRRIEESAKPATRGPNTRIGDLEIDNQYHEVRVGGRPTNLTATEFRILSLLAANPGEVFTRAHLLDRLNDNGEIFERTLDRHINNLRRKIEVDPAHPHYVVTVYGVGYKMNRL
jgi:two-component system, OmpR family, alkaline phosphatase synthesis response regulator PhoP